MKEKETEPPKPEENEAISDEYDLIKHAISVHSPPKDNITTDFVLATLNEKDKEGIIEMSGDAAYSGMLIDKLICHSKRWEWNKEKRNWEKKGLPPEEIETLKKLKQTTYDAYMMKIYMTTIMNRNVDTNFIMKMIGKAREEAPEEEEKELKEKIMKAVKPESEKEKK